MSEVRPAPEQELAAVAELVGRAFADDPLITWTEPSGSEPGSVSVAFFTAFHGVCFPHGWLWVVGDEGIDGMVMWVPPDPEDRYGRAMKELDPAVAEIMGERKAVYDELWGWIDHHRPTEPHWYLEHIAVRPERRGVGLGRALIEHGLGRADADGTTAWLVTSKPGNVPLYERFGFEVRAAEDAPGRGPHLWFMGREPTQPA